MAEPHRVLIADDHILFRRGLASLLNETTEFSVVGEASSGPEAVQLAGELQPDVVLMDVHMPGGEGVDAVRVLHDKIPALPVIMLTVSETDADLLNAIRAGARGYFLKNVEMDELFAGIRSVLSGQATIHQSLTDRLFEHVAHSTEVGSPLSLRETEILRLIAESRTNREIAALLYVSENTVKTHVARILEKLGVPSRSDAVALAQARGWISTSTG